MSPLPSASLLPMLVSGQFCPRRVLVSLHICSHPCLSEQGGADGGQEVFDLDTPITHVQVKLFT